jgi:hypothetical protein
VPGNLRTTTSASPIWGQLASGVEYQHGKTTPLAHGGIGISVSFGVCQLCTSETVHRSGVTTGPATHAYRSPSTLDVKLPEGGPPGFADRASGDADELS